MAKFSDHKTSFLAGEIGPRVLGRIESDQYKEGAIRLKNALVHKAGGAYKRPGTRFLTNNITGNALGVPSTFQTFNERQRIIGLQYEGNPTLLLIEAFFNEAGDTFPQTSTLGFMYAKGYALNYEAYYATSIVGAPGGVWYEPTANLSTSIRTFTGYSVEDLPKIQVEQTGGTYILTCEGRSPVVLSLDVFGTLTVYDWWRSNTVVLPDLVAKKVDATSPIAEKTAGQGADTNVYRLGLYERLAPFSISFAAVSAGASTTFTITGTGSIASLDKTIVRVKTSATPPVDGFALINTHNLANNTGTCDILKAIPVGANVALPLEVGDYPRPRCAAFHEGRLMLGFNQAKLIGSQIGSYGELNYSPNDTFANDRPLEVKFANAAGGSFNWMVAGKNLRVGTSTSEGFIYGPDNTLGIGPANIGAAFETEKGSAYRQAIKDDNATIFLSRDKTSFLLQYYNKDQNDYAIQDLNLFADHFLQRSMEESGVDTTKMSGIRASYEQYVYHKSAQILWAIDSYNNLVSLTYSREGRSQAWTRHDVGGKVLSICTMPYAVVDDFGYVRRENYDALYLLIKRTINGSDVVYLEMLSPVPPFQKQFHGGHYQENDSFFFADSAKVIYSATAASVFTGLAHLANKSVTVVANGADLGDFTVSALGVLDLTAFGTYNHVVVGLKYDTEIIPTVPQLGAQNGSPNGLVRRINEVAVIFDRTTHCEFGPNTNENLKETINFRDVSVPASDETPFFSGTKRMTFPGDFSEISTVRFFSDRPQPLHIVSVTFKGSLNEG